MRSVATTRISRWLPEPTRERARCRAASRLLHRLRVIPQANATFVSPSPPSTEPTNAAWSSTDGGNELVQMISPSTASRAAPDASRVALPLATASSTRLRSVRKKLPQPQLRGAIGMAKCATRACRSWTAVYGSSISPRT
jgi:hypothetical protein